MPDFGGFYANLENSEIQVVEKQKAGSKIWCAEMATAARSQQHQLDDSPRLGIAVFSTDERH